MLTEYVYYTVNAQVWYDLPPFLRDLNSYIYASIEIYVIAKIWEEFLKIMKEEAGSRMVETWFKAVSFAQWDSVNKIAYLQVPNTFVRDWIQGNYIPLVQMHLGRLLHVDAPKVVLVDHNPLQAGLAHQNGADARTIQPAVLVSFDQDAPKELMAKPTLAKANFVNKSYSFETFVVGPNNSLAYAAAHAVTEKPGVLYNPLFIYGGSGLGKTHLLHSIGNEIKTKYKQASVLYQPADRFVNEFINAIRFDKIHKFQEKYRDIDVLLIDDIQFISNKEQTQEAFFHIFNSLYEAHKQIVFSSDTFPQDIQGIAERLRSRLACGLVADIYMPSIETKIAILKKKAETSNEILDDEVVNFIASRSVSNIRELEGALIRVMAFACLTSQPITLDLAKRVLIRCPEASGNGGAVDFDRVVKCLQRHYSCDLSSLRSKSRNKELSFTRQIAMFLMKKVTHKSLRDIGEFLGGRDHSTVVHAIEKIEKRAAQDTILQRNLQRMEEEIVS